MIRSLALRAFALFLASALNSIPASSADLQTLAEKTNWEETGRYAEVERLCPAFQATYPESVSCFTFGQTPEGRPMLAMAIGEKAYLTANRASERPVVAFQGGIHAGEIDGKDAGFEFVRDVLDHKILPGILSKVTLLFIPVFNVDGHERFGAYGRPNQIGPKEKGWRVTAQNLNLNRDYLKADAPEMVAMLTLLENWNPLVYVDLHVTDGAKFQHDVGVMIEPSNGGPKDLRQVAATLTDDVMSDLKAKGHLPLSTYPSFNEEDEPKSGISQRPAKVGFSNGYWAYRNRIGVLVETHSWKPYAHRVKTTYDTLVSIVDRTAKSGPAWLNVVHKTEDESSKLVGQSIPLAYGSTKKQETIDFLGYAYTRKPSAVSGQLMTRYDETKPEVWRIPFYPEAEAKVQDQVPDAFIIPAAYSDLFAAKLKLHGIAFDVLKKPWQGKAEVFRLTEPKSTKTLNESHQKIEYDGTWEPANGSAGTGSLRVSMHQPLARLAMMMLDPKGPDSLLAWGYLNQIFEQKEYMEPYVAEEVAERMLKDPKVKAEFEAKLKNPEFAKDPEKRLEFFAAKHPSHDSHYLLYPVMRVDGAN